MSVQAEIVLHYGNSSIAKAVAMALSPDNLRTPTGLAVTTIQKRRKVITEIKCKGKMDTFIATIDDLLSSASIAENTLRATMRSLSQSLEQ
jgi:hypothetical protein